MDLKFKIIWMILSTNYVDMITLPNVNLTRCEKYNGWGIPTKEVLEDNEEETLTDSSLCAYKCMEKSYCRAASFSHPLDYCAYKTWQYIYLTKMENSVFIILKDIPVSYVWSESVATVEEARKLCADVGQHLITLEQLDDLRQYDEYTRCQCGFVANGHQYVPMGEYRDYCEYPVGMNSCNSQTAAYCTTM